MILTSPHTLAPLRDGIVAWWLTQEFVFPWRSTDLDEWQLLVSEVLLQRTRATAVATMFADFFLRFPNPEALGSASVEDVEQVIHSIGLRWRAKWLVPLGAALAARGGTPPATRKQLEELPGVGPYAAGAFLRLHRGEEEPFVDANIVRLLGRYLGFEWDGETRRKRWLTDLVDVLFDNDHDPAELGYALLDFTREVCSQRPRCGICPIRNSCVFGKHSLPLPDEVCDEEF